MKNKQSKRGVKKRLARWRYAPLYDGFMITPLGSTVINVALCAAGGLLFAFGLGAISKAVLKKTSLV